ncbi:MAG: class I SAM-dependent methyltransferase [Syntrophales bacterium]
MDSRFDLLDYGIAFSPPRRLTDVGSWHLHIPFAFVMTAILKPRTFVELGTHKGDSYCAFCQAVEELGLNAVCCAVDSWQGDEHAGFYGDAVLGELRAYHDPLYGGFSSLRKSLFDEARDRFPAGSIDLLHIDGHHTYDSVRHDFESWLPKMSERGVVLLHDTAVREGDFGVWRLWNEIARRYPSFEFPFGHGLGVLAVGGQIDERVRAFLEYGKDREPGVSRFFHLLGTKNVLDREKKALAEKVHQLENALLASDRELHQTEEWRRQNEAMSAEKDRQLEEAKTLLGEKSRRLDEIYASRGWQWLTRFRRWKEMGRV